jgi:hypothetical protein
MKLRYVAIVLALALTLISPNAMAGDKWEFDLVPYLWFSGFNGQVSTVPGEPPADVDASFSDILDNLDFAIFFAGEARKGRWGMAADLMYIDLESGGDFPGPEFSTVNLDVTNWIVSGAGYYRVVEGDGPFLDLLAGVRYWDVTNDLFLSAGAYPDTPIVNSDSWFDPMVGLKGRTPLGESRFSFGGHLMAGGFGVGSDMMWDLRGDFGYHWDNTGLILGYRYITVEYEEDTFLFDITMDGPMLGFIWRF